MKSFIFSVQKTQAFVDKEGIKIISLERNVTIQAR